MTTEGRLAARMPEWALDWYRSLRFKYGFKRGHHTWSQEGEDMILRRIFDKAQGFYVDIGAHHPYRYSNTFYLYRLGWCGINVDALPEAIALFERARPNDINVNVGISRSGGAMHYFQFNDAAYNTFDESLANDVQDAVHHVRLLRETVVVTISLEDLLDTKLAPGVQIDLMNVDVEGLDMDVLESNNWIKYRPAVLLVEVQWKTLEEIFDCSVYKFLSAQGYEMYAKCVNTVVFRDLQTTR